MIVWIYLIEYFFLSLKQAECQQQNIDFIYSPFYQQKYDIQDPQGASTKIKVAEKANLVFISAGFGGIIIIDGTTNQIIFEQKAEEFLFTLEATSDGEYVMTSYQGKFSIFQFVGRRYLTLKSQVDFPTSIIDLFMDSKETTVYAVGLQGQMVAYNIKNKSEAIKIGSFNALSNIIHQGQITNDGKWILLGNDLRGLTVLVISQNEDGQQEFQLVGEGIMVWKTWAVTITNDNKYLYGLDNWNGIFICDFNQIISAPQNSYPISITFSGYWPFKEINPSVYSLKITKDNNYLLVGVRSQGVYIFNIEDRLNPIYFQGIPVGAHAFSIALSKDEQYLYYANAQSIYIFGRTPPNLNNNYPNLFNFHQASVQKISDTYYIWRCYTRNINQKMYYFGPFDAKGIGIFDSTDPYNIMPLYVKQYQAASLVNSLEISKDNKYLYVPIQEDGTAILVLDIADFKNPVEVFRLKMPFPNHGEAIFFSKDYQYIVNSYDNGILLIDASSPPDLVLLDYWHILPFMTGENAGVMITNDNNWIIGSVRGYGIYLLDAKLKNKLQLVTQMQTLGAEGIIPSLYDNSYAYLFDGFKGIAILDLKALPELKILSRVNLQGWSNALVPLQNDQYLLVAQLEAGMVTLIDIQDKSNPRIISTYQYQKQSAQSICLTPNQEYSFINNNLGTIVLPLRSRVYIHTEVQQILTSEVGTQTLIVISKDEFLKVGQTIQFNFVPLYPQEGMNIVSVSYYEQEQIKSLPFWMKYDSNKRNLLLQIDKSSLGEEREKASLNTILLKIAVPLNEYSFIFEEDDLKTTEVESSKIFNHLQNEKILSSRGLITDSFDFTQDINFKLDGVSSDERLFELVRLTLQRGMFVNPVVFSVQPSLYLNVKDETEPIKTLSLNVQIYLLVDQSFGKFVMMNFPGVIASTTDSQNQLKLEGSLTNLNRVLQQKVIFANQTEMKSIKVKINVIDGVNYQISQNYLISQCVFIKQKLQLKKNPEQPLQNQFQIKFPNNEVNIEEEFTIDFSATSFIAGDIQTIVYKAQILNGNEYSELTNDHWIQFQTTSGNINFHGTPPVSVLGNVFNLKVIASDGYTSDSDTFMIKSSGLPFIIVFNLLLKIFGPIFAVLGVYKYKSLILNSVNRNVIMFSPETAIRGQVYKKKITVLGDDMEKCKLLFEQFIVRFTNDRAKFIEETQHVKNILQRYGSDTGVEKSPKQTANNNLPIGSFDLQKLQNQDYVLSPKQPGEFSQPRRLKVINKDRDVQLHNSTQIILMSQKHTRLSPLEREYLNKDGGVSLSKILRDMSHKNVQFMLTGKKFSASNFLTDFKNKDSRIYKGLKALASRYFLKQDIRSLEVYNYIKYYAQNQFGFKKNDWYRGLVTISATDEKDCYGFPVPFSKLILKDDVINLILIDLQVHNRIGQTFESLGELNINYILIREVLFADAWGLVEKTPSVFSPCVGESIHLHPYEIGSVEAFKQVKNAWCLGIRKLLNYEFMSYGMSKNMTLPNWIEFDHKNGVISLEGLPQSQDVEELLIRIIDIDQYVIKQYLFNVVDEFIEQSERFDHSYVDTMIEDQSMQFSMVNLSPNTNRKKKKFQKSPMALQQSSIALIADEINLNSLANKQIKFNNEEIIPPQFRIMKKNNNKQIELRDDVSKQTDCSEQQIKLESNLSSTNSFYVDKVQKKSNLVNLSQYDLKDFMKQQKDQYLENLKTNEYSQQNQKYQYIKTKSSLLNNSEQVSYLQDDTNQQFMIKQTMTINDQFQPLNVKKKQSETAFINSSRNALQDMNESMKREEETSRQFFQNQDTEYQDTKQQLPDYNLKNLLFKQISGESGQSQRQEQENSEFQQRSKHSHRENIQNEEDDMQHSSFSRKNINKIMLSSSQNSQYFSSPYQYQ